MNFDGDGRLSKYISGLVGYFLFMKRRCARVGALRMDDQDCFG